MPVLLRPIRICLVASNFPPDINGIGDYTYFLANSLAAMGHEVHVLTSVGSNDPLLYPLAERVEVHRVVKSWGVLGLSHALRFLRTLECETLIIQYAPHAFNRRGMTLAVNILPLLVRVSMDCRVVVNFHELYIPFDRRPAHVVAAVWQRIAAFMIASLSNTVMASSGEWAKRLRRIGVWRAIRAVPVGSTIPRSQTSASERADARRELGVTDSILLIGCFGSAGPDRDKEMLSTAVHELLQSYPVKVIWLGKAGLPFGLHPTWAQEIVWTGPLPHSRVSRLLAACDVIVLPFAHGISTRRTTLAAALLHGVPVVSTRGESISEMFVHGENVYLVAPGDAKALANGLLDLASSPSLRTRLGRGAEALYATKFDWDVIAPQVADAAIYDVGRS